MTTAIKHLEVQHYNADTQVARVRATIQRGINMVNELLFLKTAVPVSEGQMLKLIEQPEIQVSYLVDEKTQEKRTFKWLVSGVDIIAEGEE